MHPVFANPRLLLAYVLAWLIAGALAAAGLVQGVGAEPVAAATFALPLALLCGFVALSAYYPCRSRPLTERRWPGTLLAFAAAALLSAGALVLAALAWNLAPGVSAPGARFVVLPPPAWAGMFAATALLYLLSLLAHDVLVAFETVRDGARREAEQRGLARDAELQLLRTQINPHFLFNSLNSISALTGSDPAGARAMTIDLAQFFRRTLALAERERVPLADEQALAAHYLAIEQRRFGARLACQFHIAPDAAAALLPPMSLQPLLENAVKHGIRTLSDGGQIDVRALVRDGWLHLAVSNPFAADAPADPAAAGQGLGLRNLSERLALLYGARARLEVRRDAGRFHVEITLPLTLRSTE